jgi:hypothetical protein
MAAPLRPSMDTLPPEMAALPRLPQQWESPLAAAWLL